MHTDFERIGQFDHTSESVDRRKELEGFMASKRNASAKYQRRVTEAAKLMAAVQQGLEDPFLLQEAMHPRREYAVAHLIEKYPGLFDLSGGSNGAVGLRETMSVSDYTALYVDVLDRMFYGYYNAAPIPNKPLVKMHPLRDFRTVKRFLEDGMTTPLTIVKNGAPVPERAQSPESVITYYPDLYAAQARINWRALINDDLGIFNDIPRKLAIAGNRAIHQFITGLYVDANGPHANLYKTAYANKIITANGASVNNPPLSIQGIQDAFKVLARMRDPDGQPIILTGKLWLWYGPALVATAENLANMLSSYVSVEGGLQNADGFPTQFVQVNNWAMQNMGRILDQYIPIVCTTAGVQDTMWGLTYDPNSQERPSLEMGFLNGFETPQLYRKLPNTMRMGGGVDQALGDFDTMEQQMKIITVFGGTQIDGRTTVASTGQGS